MSNTQIKKNERTEEAIVAPNGVKLNPGSKMINIDDRMSLSNKGIWTVTDTIEWDDRKKTHVYTITNEDGSDSRKIKKDDLWMGGIDRIGVNWMLVPDDFKLEMESLVVKMNQETGEGIQASEETAIVTGNVGTMIAAKNQAKLVEYKSHMIISAINQLMLPLKEKMYVMRQQVKYLDSVLEFVEQYSGIGHQVVQIQSGEYAPPHEKLTIRQEVRFMDEEAGAIDFNHQKGIGGADDLQSFSEWFLSKPEYLEEALPSQRCIIGYKYSRQKHIRETFDLSEAMTILQLEQQDRMLEVFVRDGENIWAIYVNRSDDRLFPTSDEWKEAVEKAQAEQEGNRSDSHFEGRKARNAILSQVGMLQAILNLGLARVPSSINLFDESTYQDSIELIRDLETLDISEQSGRPSFRNWRSENNSKIERGSRVLLLRPFMDFRSVGGSYETGLNRFDARFHHNRPELPSTGVYSVESGKSKWREDEYLVIKTPHVRNIEWWEDEKDFQERLKNARRVSFEIEKNDNFILHLDGTTLEDVDYYIKARHERRHFTHSLPILYAIRVYLIEEKEHEDEFVKYFMGIYEIEEEKVREAIEWWKTKVVYTRYLSSDNEKAWRMITKRLKLNPGSKFIREVCFNCGSSEPENECVLDGNKFCDQCGVQLEDGAVVCPEFHSDSYYE